MKNIDFANMAKKIANDYKTLYVYGCFGAPMTATNKIRYCNHTSYNMQATRTAMIKAASTDTFGFDCVGLIKGILWGWNGGKTKTYGGATYASNGVPDIGADAMIKKCSDLSTDFSNIEIGEAVWISGHIGIYIGDGLVVESTPRWKNGVQITACNRTKTGYNRRDWAKHGKLPYVEYVGEITTPATNKKSVTEIAKEVIDGKWYSGAARKSALKKAGYDYDTVQSEVNKLLKSANSANDMKPAATTDSLAEFIKEIQKVCGAAVDGIAGPETLSKTVTVSAKYNKRHAVVKVIQKRLYDLGYTEVGTADGIAGPKFTSAVAHFQQDNDCVVDGVITKNNKTWTKFLGMA